MLRLLVDGYALGDGSQLRGIGGYVHHVLRALAARDDVAVTVLAHPRAAVPEGVARLDMRRRAPARAAWLEHDLLVARDLRRAPADVVHSPAQHVPRRSPAPLVQSLHDVIPLSFPSPLTAPDARRWRRLAPRLRRAAVVVTGSRFSADEGVRHLDLDPRRVEVVPYGVDPAVFHPAPEPGGQGGAPAEPYLLHVASFGPHKGHGEAARVVDRLRRLGHRCRLVLAGFQDPVMLGRVRQATGAGPDHPYIDIVGHVPDLADLYRRAAALVVTSRCEGFGLPAVEAMACGTPVVSFANSSLTEVVGEGGLLVPDGDVDAMVAALRPVLDDEQVRAELSARGLTWSTRYRWEATVAGLVPLYRSLVA